MVASPPSARTLAARVLRDIDKHQGFSNRWLSHHLERHPDLDPRDRGLVTTLVYGVLRHRARLDVHIDRHATRPAGLKGEVRQLLRIAAYELRELERPAAVAIAEARKALRTFDRSGRLAGVAQAVLGGIDREGHSLDVEIASGSPLNVLERRWSIPRWLAGRWLKQLGPDLALARAQVIAAPPTIDLRIDLSRTNRDAVITQLNTEHPGIRIEVVPDQPQALRCRGGGDLFYGPLHAEGLISVQGLAAQQAVLALDPQPGERILDACAGMGVKTLQIAEQIQRRGHIVAADADARQLDGLEALRNRGLAGPELVVDPISTDLTQPHPALDDTPFDRVLLDVPCTGLGNLARHPEIRWYRRYEDIAARVELQTTLLERTKSRVRVGGILVYAACTFAPEEGEKLVERHANEPFELVSSRTWTPEIDHTEGFYVAVLRRLR